MSQFAPIEKLNLNPVIVFPFFFLAFFFFRLLYYCAALLTERLEQATVDIPGRSDR